MKCIDTIRKTLRTAGLVAAAAIVCAPALNAQVSSYGDKEAGPANVKSSLLSKVGIAQHLNYQLPLNLTFTDDTGKQVPLASYFRQKAGHPGAGVLPLSHALLRGAGWADQRAFDGG